MRIALAQINTLAGDIEGNAERVLAAADRARAQGADVCVFPELALVGYAPYDLLERPHLVAAACDALRVIAHAMPDITLIVGTVQPAPRRIGAAQITNTAAVLNGGRIVATQAKTLLPSTDVFHETRYFVPATSRRCVPLGDRQAGLLICEDMWDSHYDVKPAAELAAAGAELLVVLSASPYRQGVMAQRLAHARRPALPLVYVNGVGGQDELIFDGGSFVLNAAGNIAVQLPRFKEAMVTVDMDNLPEAELEPPAVVAEADLFAALALGLRDFTNKNAIPHVFVGLSGGIDSSVVAALAVEALGPERVRGLALPSRYTDARSTQAAYELAANLGVAMDTVAIEPLFTAATTSLASLLTTDLGTTAENIQARLRALVLMAHVNRYGGMLLNTSNKTELALGYTTLYGDMAGALSPLGDVSKPQVYALARWFNATHQGTIPAFVIERAPTAELRANQTDPFDYDRVGPIADALVNGSTLATAITPAPDDDEQRHLTRLYTASEHKRWQAPPILKVSDKAFGLGRLHPITFFK